MDLILYSNMHLMKMTFDNIWRENLYFMHSIRNNYRKSHCNLSFINKKEKCIEWSECDYQFDKGNNLDIHFGIHREEKCYIKANACCFLQMDYKVFMQRAFALI